MGFFGILGSNRLQESGAHSGSHCFVELTKDGGNSEARAQSLARLYE